MLVKSLVNVPGRDEDGKGGVQLLGPVCCYALGKIADGKDGRVACRSLPSLRGRLRPDEGSSVFVPDRFPIAWPRVFPNGSVRPQCEAATGLLRLPRWTPCKSAASGRLPRCSTGISPQALQEKGGWTNRATVDASREVRRRRSRARLGDRGEGLDDAQRAVGSGIRRTPVRRPCPGASDDLPTALATAHGILTFARLCAVPIRFRANSSGAPRGHCPQPGVGVSPSPPCGRRTWPLRCATTARSTVGLPIPWCSAAATRGDMLAWYGADLRPRRRGDMEAISVPVDFLGVNSYTRRVMAHDPAGRGSAGRAVLAARQVHWPFVPRAALEEWEIERARAFTERPLRVAA